MRDNIKPIYGNEEFVSFLRKNKLVEDIHTFDKEEKNKEFDTLLRCPESISIDEIFEFIKHLDLIKSFNDKITNQRLNDTKKVDLSLLFVEFMATLSLDTLVFDGLPISSGAVLTYKGIERYLKGNKNIPNAN